MQLPIPNRIVAGQALAEALLSYQNQKDVIILALPRGGVPVAMEVARILAAPLDLLLVRKLGTPNYPELAMGAISSGNIKVLNQQVINNLNISEQAIAAVEAEERQELERRQHAYRGHRPYPPLQGKTVIIVDDGLATGSTMYAAIDAVQLQHPQAVVVAVPVAPPDTVAKMRLQVDELICLFQPDDFSSIGQWYEDFSQVSDAEVQALLKEAWQK